MNASHNSSSSIGHASSSERKVGVVAPWFGLLGAPLAWMTDEMVSYLIASHSCSLKSAAQAASLVTATSPGFLALIIATFLVAVAGLGTALNNWRKTRNQSGPDRHPRSPDKERARFLAVCGLLTSIGFCLAFLFTAAYMVAAPLCGK